MNSKKDIPEVNTSALPDIIFMLLFFFMTITVIRLNEDQVKVALPEVEQLQKLEYNKSFGHIYLGKDPSLLQLNDKFIKLKNMSSIIQEYKAADNSEYKTKLYIDKAARMKDVNAVKLEIRKSKALRIEYVLDQH